VLFAVVKQLRRRHGRPPVGAALRRLGVPALVAVLGPGLLAGLSDDDPAGITTYSIAGARYGYELLWVLLLSVGALVVFHELGARLGLATGQGLVALVRSRYGKRSAFVVMATLVVANTGTTCAEFAGVAAGLELAGVSRYLSVPAAAVLVGFVVLRGSFHRIEHVLLLLTTTFIAYVAAAWLAHPDWGETLAFGRRESLVGCAIRERPAPGKFAGCVRRSATSQRPPKVMMTRSPRSAAIADGLWFRTSSPTTITAASAMSSSEMTRWKRPASECGHGSLLPAAQRLPELARLEPATLLGAITAPFDCWLSVGVSKAV
jgi:hypothetical protein